LKILREVHTIIGVVIGLDEKELTDNMKDMRGRHELTDRQKRVDEVGFWIMILIGVLSWSAAIYKCYG